MGASAPIGGRGQGVPRQGRMNRSKAQQQLAALAQAVREGKALTPEDYPVLWEPTHQSMPLWQLSGARIATEH